MTLARNPYAARALLALLLAAAGLCRADAGGSWTNRVGHVLRATPTAISGGKVSFVLDGSGRTVAYPLSVFQPEEQERLRCRLRDTTVPEGLKEAYAFSASIIRRSRALWKNGGMTEAEFQAARDKALAAFRARAEPFVDQKTLSRERLTLVERALSEAEVGDAAAAAKP